MARLLAVNRHQMILARLQASETATVEELADALDVSRETIRRDLKHLAKDGLLGVVHGGAIRREGVEAPFTDRHSINRDAKAIVGELAVDLITDGMTILLDSGTTTAALVEALARSSLRKLNVHTTSIVAARGIARLPGAVVHLIGGTFDANEDATSGSEARRSIGKLAVDLAFVGVGSIAPDGQICDYSRLAAATRTAMLNASERAYFLADHSKFGLHMPSIVAHAEVGLITDRRPTAGMIAALKARGVTITAPRN